MFKKLMMWMIITILGLNTISPAFAQQTQGQAQAQAFMANFQDLLVRGDVKVTRNELGTIIAELPPGETTDQLFALAGSSPYLWAKYYLESASGTIQSTHLRKDIQTGAVQLITENLTPSMGQKFGIGNDIAPDFNGTNPFQDFNSGGAAYTGVGLGGFMAVVGMWAKHKTAQKGYLVTTNSKFHGVFKWNKCIKKILKACIKKRFHQEAYATVKPNWYVMGPSEIGTGRNIIAGYTSDSCIASGGTVNKCQVRGGVSFLKVTDGSDFPVAEEKFWHYHEYQDGWAGWLTGLLTFVAMLFVPVAIGWAFAAALGMQALQYVVTGVGPTDYQDGIFGKQVDGKSMGQKPGKWSPVGCIGGTASSSGAKSGGRYGRGECKSFATGDFMSTGAGVGTFGQEKVQNPQFDWNISNDVQVLRENPEPPTKWDGTPARF